MLAFLPVLCNRVQEVSEILEVKSLDYFDGIISFLSSAPRLFIY